MVGRARTLDFYLKRPQARAQRPRKLSKKIVKKMELFQPEGLEYFLVNLWSKILLILINFRACYKGTNLKSLKAQFFYFKSLKKLLSKRKNPSPARARKIRARPTSIRK
jgi:hypothetical protein